MAQKSHTTRIPDDVITEGIAILADANPDRHRDLLAEASAHGQRRRLILMAITDALMIWRWRYLGGRCPCCGRG